MTSSAFLLKLVNTLAGFAATPIKNKLERTETIIGLLKKLGFEPDHPPADFDGVYAYTLVEYGVGKQKPILELFRQNEIRQAFREAFDQNDLSILLKKGQKFADSDNLGDQFKLINQIKEIGIEPSQEFATFGMYFLAVTKKTRNPAEVVRDQKLDDLQQGISYIQDQLTRFKEPKDYLLALALQAQKYQEIQPQNDSNVGKVRKFILAQQMKSWFAALKYDIESYEVEGDTHFELLIRIPVRRGYERILVRGVEGEAKLADVIALRKTVNEQKTKEGWLVAARRISQAACEEAKKQEDQEIIFCYTFDELLDQDADFNNYLDWLEAEVKRKGIDRMYVPLSCTKDEFDPDTKEKIGISSYDAITGWTEGYIERWLDDPSKEHISILGEFGTGKTWLTLHYAWTALQKYRSAKEKGIERPRIPLVIPLRDHAKAVSVESLFSEFFFRKHEIPLPGYSVFEQLNRMGKLLLIFDGFDEMADRVDNQKMINNFWELARVVVPGSKAILTCRTEHFPEAKEGRALLNAELKASISSLTGEPPQFELLELVKFDDEQIRQALSFRAEVSTVNEIMSNPQLLDLARRPVMTELILEALPEIEAGSPIDMSRIYLYAVREKMKRDIKAERTFTSLADKLYFLCELSWEMLSTDQMSLNYRLFPDQLRRFFGDVVQEQKNLDHWHYDMMGQTLLIRNDDGDYRPAHRSLLEFFVAYKFAAELGILAPDFLELAQAQSYLNEDQASESTWSSYFRRQYNEKGKISFIPPLSQFLPENIDLLAKTLGSDPLTTAQPGVVLELIKDMISLEKEKIKKRLMSVILKTRDKSSAEVGVVGGNTMSILKRYDSKALRNQKLQGVDLRCSDFQGADLTGCNLSDSNLSYSRFDLKSTMLGTQLQGCNLSCISLRVGAWIYSHDLSRYGLEGFVHFNYPGEPKYPRSGLFVQENETIITYIEEDSSVRWVKQINSICILPNLYLENNLLHFLTIEGEQFSIKLNTGEFTSNEEAAISLYPWQDADLSGALGLTNQDVYLLSVLGAVNLPKATHKAFYPKGDERLYITLRTILARKSGSPRTRRKGKLH
jgi:predicted NACHT family NTPase